jgi:hypothetical protein
MPTVFFKNCLEIKRFLAFSSKKLGPKAAQPKLAPGLLNFWAKLACSVASNQLNRESE